MSPIVLGIWWVMVIATVFVVLPVLLRFLVRTLDAARQIRSYSESILSEAGQVADNVEAAQELQTTLSAAPTLLARAEGIAVHAAAIESRVAVKGSGNGRSAGGEACFWWRW